MGHAASNLQITPSSPSQSCVRLPKECLLMIFQRCDPATLCNARLVSRDFAFISQPPFWHDIRLVPNVDCLTAFTQLLQHSSARLYIKHLIYDTSWQPLSTEFRSLADHPDRRKPRIDSTVSVDDATSILRRCSDGNIDPSGHKGKGTELLQLRRLLCALPQINKITVENEYRYPFMQDNLPPYYRQICQKAGITVPDRPLDFNSFKTATLWTSNHYQNLLMAVNDSELACTSFALKKLRFEGFLDRIPYSSPYNHDFLMTIALFKKMQHLDLSFSSSYSPLVDTKRLRTVLKKCHVLHELRLTFRPLTDRAYSKNQHSNSVLSGLLSRDGSRRPLLKEIRKLHLNKVTSTQQELVTFLSIHAATLCHLEIFGATLVSEPDSSKRGCWVAVIKELQSKLSLESVQFKNWLSNGARQCWYVSSDRADDNRIRPRVERFVTNKAIKLCPLESVAIKPECDDLPKPANGIEVEGDWTWTMTYAGGCKGWPKKNTTVSGPDLFTHPAFLDIDPTLDDPTFWKPQAYAATKARYSQFEVLQPSTISGTSMTWKIMKDSSLTGPAAWSPYTTQPIQPPPMLTDSLSFSTGLPSFATNLSLFSTQPAASLLPSPPPPPPPPDMTTDFSTTDGLEHFDFDSFLNATTSENFDLVPAPAPASEGGTGDLNETYSLVEDDENIEIEDVDEGSDLESGSSHYEDANG